MSGTRLCLAPGDGRLLRRAHAVLFLPAADADLVAAFTAADDGAELQALASATVGSGFAVAPFAAVSWRNGGARVMAFGDVAVETDQPTLPMLSGAGSRTWVEHSLVLTGVASVTVGAADAVLDDTALDAGIAIAGGFLLQLDPSDDHRVASADTGRNGALAPTAGADATAARPDDATGAVPRPPSISASDASTTGETGTDAPTEPDPAPATFPPAPVDEAPVLQPASDAEAAKQIKAGPEPDSETAPSGSPAPPAEPGVDEPVPLPPDPPPPATDPPRPPSPPPPVFDPSDPEAALEAIRAAAVGEDGAPLHQVGATATPTPSPTPTAGTSAPDDSDLTLAPPDVDAVLAEATAPGGRESLVDAKVCSHGHANPPTVATCAVCGELLPPSNAAVVHVARPSLGALVLDDGVRIPLDAELLLGRNPDRDHDPTRTGLRRIKVPGDKVSRSHLEIRFHGWDVVVVDLGSTNGSFVVAEPGGPVVALDPTRPQLVEPGATVYFGSRSFTVTGRDSA